MNTHDAARSRVLERLAHRGDYLWQLLQDANECDRARLTSQLSQVDRFIRRLTVGDA